MQKYAQIPIAAISKLKSMLKAQLALLSPKIVQFRKVGRLIDPHQCGRRNSLITNLIKIHHKPSKTSRLQLRTKQK